MMALHTTHPFVLELGARIALDDGRKRALYAAEVNGVALPVLYRAVHLMDHVRKSGRSPWGVVWDAYVLDGKMNGYVLIDSGMHDRDAVRDECLAFYGIRL